MQNQPSKEDESAPQLAFSDKYDEQHSVQYLTKHKGSLRHRLTTNREIKLARKALQIAGNPGSVLDLPCGAGRFWPMLAENPDRRLLAADNSANMIQTALKYQTPEVAQRFETRQCSAFDTGMESGSVEHIFCMRLIHHVGEHADRMTLLKELNRVCTDSVSISLWVDGNYQAFNRTRRRARKNRKSHNRFIIPRQTIESEFNAAGFRVKARLDVLPLISMWRIYVLEKL